MALINVPTKDPDGDLTASEFNQFLEALKDGTRDINSLNIQASTATFTGAVDFQGTVTINGEEGPYTKYWEGLNIIYVSKTGGVYDGSLYDGKSPSKALNSFQNAIDNVAAILGQAPDADNQVVIYCMDAAVYEEGISSVNYVSIFAPNAKLKLGGVGEEQLIVRRNCVSFESISRDSGTNDMIAMSATSGYGHLSASLVSDNGTGTAISCTTAQVAYINVHRIQVRGGGVGISDDNTVTGHMHVRVQSISIESNNAVGLLKTRPGTCHGFVDGISYSDYVVTGTKGIVCSDGTISFSLTELKANTAYEVSGSGSLQIYANKITGSTVVTGGTVNVVTPAILAQAVSDIAGKEDDLGTPAVNGMILGSDTDNTRYWKTAGDMTKATYDPSNISDDAFDFTNFYGHYLDFDLGLSEPSDQEGRVYWSNGDNTLSVDTGLNETHIQVGQENVRKIYNDTGQTLLNGRVVHYLPFETNGHPHAEYAIASDHTTITGSLSIVTGDILPGEYGFSTFFGKVRGMDTSGLSVGVVYLSDTTPGLLTNTPPAFPSYRMYMGAVNIVDAVDGEIIVSPQSKYTDTLQNHWNGCMREEFDFLVTSNGTTITGSLEYDGGGDLTMMFSDGFHILDCTPPQTITLVPGSNTAPVKNYVYIPISTKVLTVSTSDWPAEEHIRIADVILQNAANTQIYGAIANRNWNEHLQGSNNSGDHTHIGQWIRNRPASWYSGAEGILTPSAGNLYFSCTSGKVFQKHLQNFDAFNQGAGDYLFIVNDFTTKYRATNNLDTITTDALGVSVGGRYFNIVVWGVNNSSSEPDQIMVNLPSGSYVSANNAILDVDGYDIYDIPRDYNGAGFLIARFTIRESGGTWTVHNTQDLRGTLVSAGGGSIGGTGVSEFTALIDTPSSYAGRAGNLLLVNGTETGLDYVNGASGSFTTTDGKTVTVVNGYITSIV